MSQLFSVNDLNFDNFINEPGTFIVDFWSPTCAPCKQIEPSLEKLALDYSSKVKVLKVNVDESPKVSSKYYVRGLPTLLFIKDGSVKTQITGAVNPGMIEEKLQEVI
ncbi:MAG: thioredoxin family protein [Acidobacteriota bacterium]